MRVTGNNKRPPPWARNNAKKAIALMDGTAAYVSLLKLAPKPGQSIRKAAARKMLRNYLVEMQADGKLIITNEQEFIAPYLGTFFAGSGDGEEETERNVLFSKTSYKISGSGITVTLTTFMNIPHHAFGRIFERDLRPPEQVARAFISKDFIGTVLRVHDLADPNAAAKSFAIRFLGGFLTGTVREMDQGVNEGDSKVLDVRTFLHAKDKPEWVRRTTDKAFFFFDHADRRTRNAITDEIVDMLRTKNEPEASDLHPFRNSKLPPQS